MSPDEFLRLALASGLVQRVQLREALSEIAALRNTPHKDDEYLAVLRRLLVDRGILTTWQCGQLAEGRFKGFFLQGYKLVDHVSCGAHQKFLADDVRTGQRIEIVMTRQAEFIRIAYMKGEQLLREECIPRRGT